MSKKSKPRHLSGKVKTARKFTPASGVIPEVVESQPTSIPVAPRVQSAPVSTSRPGPTIAQPARPTLAARPRPVRVSAQAIPTNCGYVVTDLKRIGMIGASLFVLLGILTVVIH